MSESIEDAIKKSNELADKMQLLIVHKQCPTGDRNTPLMGLWSVAFELHRAILCLSYNKFFGAAQALVRPLVEAVIRSHIVIMGSDEDLKKLQDDKYRTNFTTVGKEIDGTFGTGKLFETFLEDAREFLHSFTHSGKMQLIRRFSGSDLTPNYSPNEIITTIRVSTSAVFIVNNLVTKHFNFEEEWKRSNDLFVEWGQVQENK